MEMMLRLLVLSVVTPSSAGNREGRSPEGTQAMQIEDYFDFISADEIKIRGHRIWIEDVLYEHIFREMQPSDLVRRFPSLTLEQVHACLLYYLHNRERMDQYLAAWLEHGRQMRLEQERQPTPASQRLRALAAELAKRQPSETPA